jgi:DNA-binding NarL/FixJ family response regulator
VTVAPDGDARIRVVITDDHAVMREGTQLILEAAGIDVVATAATGAEALRVVARHRPNVLLLDLQLPDTSGVEVAQIVCRDHPDVGVLILTGHAEGGYIRTLLQIGVRGYLHKMASGAEIVAAVRAVAAGRTIVMSGTVGATAPSRSEPLTARELQVLRLMAAGLRNADIARELFVSVKTVEHHVTNLLVKLRARSRTQAIVRAQQHGLAVVGAQGVEAR